MKIDQVHTTDAKKLTKLAMRSKGHWKYGPLQIDKWKVELTITPDYILQNQVYQLKVDHKLIGFYAFNVVKGKKVVLDFLFVEPAYIGKGYGKMLLNDLLQRMLKTDYACILLDADPHAEKFYERHGLSYLPGTVIGITEMLKLNALIYIKGSCSHDVFDNFPLGVVFGILLHIILIGALYTFVYRR
ncbi:GNAT family N-acetyltransferase [Catalinimonas sp. 4WD22]|uniref:GNAT family N-acetyltransferase n=1 Tax=Catalinimonas locisalis TaxID=3133978 RepID=UPI003100DC26